MASPRRGYVTLSIPHTKFKQATSYIRFSLLKILALLQTSITTLVLRPRQNGRGFAIHSLLLCRSMKERIFSADANHINCSASNQISLHSSRTSIRRERGSRDLLNSVKDQVSSLSIEREDWFEQLMKKRPGNHRR